MCGGCTFQQLDYAAQLTYKQEKLKALFSHPIKPIIPCDPPFYHRNKMEYSFSQDKAGQKFLGLHMPAARGRVINIETCYLTSPWFGQTLNSVRKWWEGTDIKAFHPPSGTGTLRTLTLREGKRTGHKMAILTISSKARECLTKEQLNSFKALFKEDVSLFLVLHQATKGHATQMFEMHLQGADHICEELHIHDRVLKCKISPLSFFQPNTFQAEKLYQEALIDADGHVLDLYAGSATLGMLFAKKAARVTSVELSPYSILDAEDNLILNEIDNIDLIRGDVAELLHTLPQSELVIVDPPRSGLGVTTCSHLTTLAPKKIIYISCNPSTQADDLKHLKDYKLTSLQPVDQFPHTPHLENIALLEHL
ncbi:MAG: 23S rRNA (uracil(1939)-C(5))-methyltransferase RlmD, partial [Chlamydiia bacterium]|nr:23S rRNA (uracil(1939)-C(5))-methyltransferase RlmD [Chlamydiia bacterium]